MSAKLEERDGVLWFDQVAFIPSIHGKAAFAREARRVFLSMRFPTVAVELPESLEERALEGIACLPEVSVVSYEESSGTRCYFPIDPCDSIVEALRLGHAEGCRLELIDREVEEFEKVEVILPDSYALGSIGLPRYYAAVEGSLPAPAQDSIDDWRERHMARRLRRLLAGGRRTLPVLCVLGIGHLRGVVRRLAEHADDIAGDEGPPAVPPVRVDLHVPSKDSLYHILGELPYTTHLYEEQRKAITLDEFDAVDKLKDLLLEARASYHAQHTEEYERISMASFQNMLQLIRNYCLRQGRLTPTLYEMALAAKGVAGSELAIQVIETSKKYPPAEQEDAGKASEVPGTHMSESAMTFGDEAAPAKRRYVAEAKEWKKLRLDLPPRKEDVARWRTAWNPFETCSWTPEDVLIENFAGHVRNRALLESGLAEERLEEFRTSFKDGIHIRETIRSMHLGKVIVKETPALRGQVGAVVILYEKPAPGKFPWKITWFPEFEWESTLALYATDYTQELVGPGIARAKYGGQLFVRTGGPIRDVWTDPMLEDARDEMERLLFAAATHSRDVYLAYVAASPPSPRMKEYARLKGKRIIYLPLSGFSRTTIEKLRRFHVLNGKPVRSWAREFIR